MSKAYIILVTYSHIYTSACTACINLIQEKKIVFLYWQNWPAIVDGSSIDHLIYYNILHNYLKIILFNEQHVPEVSWRGVFPGYGGHRFRFELDSHGPTIWSADIPNLSLLTLITPYPFQPA